MRKYTFNRKTMYITEREWAQLHNRFDVRKATLFDDEYIIQIGCSFCQIYSCSQCPFAVFQLSSINASPGCHPLILGILRKKGDIRKYAVTSLRILCNKITWEQQHDKKARRAMGILRDEILSMKKVDKRGS